MARDDLSRSHNIYVQGDDFVFKDAAGTGPYLVSCWHLHLCLEYSQRMRAVILSHNLEPPPLGYDLAVRTYNAEPTTYTAFSEFDDNGSCIPSQFPKLCPQTFFSNAPPQTAIIRVPSPPARPR